MIVSIDIGTSYSCISMLCPDGSVQSIDIGTGVSMYGSKHSLPSAVFVEDDGRILLGQDALNNRMRNPQSFRDEFKRNLGESIPFLLGNRSFLPEELYTEFFRHMKNRAEKVSGEPITLAYLTYPAAYSKAKKEKIISAARAAGLFNVELVDEPTAAAMGYCANGYIKNDQNVLVYDFGGGTFDVALIHHQNGNFTSLAEPKGLERCGGIDIDRLIFQDMLNAVPADVLNDLRSHSLHYMRFVCQLSELAVKCKHQLSSPDVDAFESFISINFDMIPYRLTLEAYNQMIAKLVGQTIQTCRQALEEAKMKISDLSAILLVGGTSRVRLVQEMVEQMAGSIPVYSAADLDLAVSKGVLSLNMDQLMERLRQEKILEEERLRKKKALEAERAAKAKEVKKIADILCYVNNTEVARLKQEQYKKEEDARINKLIHTPLRILPCRLVSDNGTQDGTLRLYRNRLVFLQSETKEAFAIMAEDIVKFRSGMITVQPKQGNKVKYQFQKMARADRQLLQEYLEKNQENQREMAHIAKEVARIEAEEQERIRQEKRKVEIPCCMNRVPGTLYLRDRELLFIATSDKQETRISHSSISNITYTDALKGDGSSWGWSILLGILLFFLIFPIFLAQSLRPMANITAVTGTKKTFWGKTKNLYTSYCFDTIAKDQRVHLANYLKQLQS